MPNAHIVLAHPEAHSYAAAMATVVEEQLRDAGYAVTLSDLYRMMFDPVLSREDFKRLENPDHLAYTREQRHAYANHLLADDIAAEVDRVLAADVVALVFPVYWFSVPAIMKGWIDRILLSGPFYSRERMYANGGMRGKRALVVASLGGRPDMYGPDGVHGEIDVMLRHILVGSLGVVGFDVLTPFFAYHVPYGGHANRVTQLEALRAHVRRLDQLPAAPLPTYSHPES